MALELAAAKLLSPYFGSTFYVWAVLLTVSLLALTAGAALGGWIADRRPDRKLLTTVLAAAGLCLLPLPPARSRLLEAAGRLGPEAGPWAGAAMILLLPLALLAAVGPILVRLATRNLAGAGRSAGGLYSLATLGSLAGALGTGYVLAPHMGLRAILWLLTAALGLTALFCRLAER